MNDDTLFFAKCLLWLACGLTLFLVGFWVFAVVHSMFSSAQALLQIAGT